MSLQAGGGGLDSAPDIAEPRAAVQHELLAAGNVVAAGELIATIAPANSRAHPQPPPPGAPAVKSSPRAKDAALHAGAAAEGEEAAAVALAATGASAEADAPPERQWQRLQQRLRACEPRAS